MSHNLILQIEKGALTPLFLCKTKSLNNSLIYMIILKQQAGAQTFKIIPRSTTADSMILKEEGTENSETYSITLNTDSDSYFSTITEALTLREGFWYSLTVKNGSEVIYKDRVYCTNQTISDFTINNGEYIEKTHDNSFIIIS